MSGGCAVKMRKVLVWLGAGLVLLGAWTVPGAFAQSTVSVLLSFDPTLIDGVPGVSRTVNGYGQPVYLPWDNIALRLSLSNAGPEDVVTPAGFGALPFHLYLAFVGPDGRGIVSPDLPSGGEPGAAMKFVGPDGGVLQVEPVEVLPGSSPRWGLEVAIPNAHDNYPLGPAGRYRVTASIPFRQYPQVDFTDSSTVPSTFYSALSTSTTSSSLTSNTLGFSIVEDRDCDGYFSPDGCGNCPKPVQCASTWAAHPEADCDDNNPNVNPGAPEVPDGVVNNCDPNGRDLLGVMGTVVVRADLHTVASGSYPGSSKEPLANLPVKILDRSAGSCVYRSGMTWQNYPAIWSGCAAVGEGVTDAAGRISFIVPPGEYAVFGLYRSGADNVYVGGGVDPVLANRTVTRYLQVIRKADGKNTPGKYTVRTGSELLIIEPEYVEWTGGQELYPFIFQSLGDWGVTTSILPPEGFVADHPSLSAEVNNALTAVQFVVTDVGSSWVDTEVEHLLRHKKKVEKVKSRIGVVNHRKEEQKKKK